MNVESKKGTQIDIFKAIGKVTILKADLKQWNERKFEKDTSEKQFNDKNQQQKPYPRQTYEQ